MAESVVLKQQFSNLETHRLTTISNFYSGTSNIVLPVANKSLYPEAFLDKTRLTYYASLFNSLEVNSSFYKIPMAKTVAKWVTEVPDDFRFTFKLWKGITHNKELVFNPDDITRFFDVIGAAGNNKGSVLVQFPPSLVCNMKQLHYLLSHLQVADPKNTWDIAVEFRNKSWYNEHVYELLAQYKMAMVIHDLPASATPITATEASFIYLRFHGPESGYRGSYEEDVLSEFAEYIKEWLADGKTVYTYFNNTAGAAVHNLITLNNLVDQ